MTVKHDMDEKGNFFKSLSLFRDWNRRRLTTMMYAAQARTFPTRCHLFRAGEPTDGLYFIRAGYCKVCHGPSHCPPPAPPAPPCPPASPTPPNLTPVGW
jgi:hypothetical protein